MRPLTPLSSRETKEEKEKEQGLLAVQEVVRGVVDSAVNRAVEAAEEIQERQQFYDQQVWLLQWLTNKRKGAVFGIKRWWRRIGGPYVAIKRWKRLKEAKAHVIQRAWKAYLTRKWFLQVLKYKDICAGRIQRWYKGICYRRMMKKAVREAGILQVSGMHSGLWLFLPSLTMAPLTPLPSCEPFAVKKRHKTCGFG